MFAVIYKGSILPGKEEEDKKLWHQVATYFKEHRGALGSCLHKAEDGEWVAYSRWPDKQTRDASWPGEESLPNGLNSEIQSAIQQLKECIDPNKPFQEICMTIMDDLLI